MASYIELEERFDDERFDDERFREERLAPPFFADERFEPERFDDERFAPPLRAEERLLLERFELDFFAEERFELLFLVAILFSPELEWERPAIPRWIGGRTATPRTGARPRLRRHH